MKIELEPTNEFQHVNGVKCRIWEGQSGKGVPVRAWIATVSPQTVDETAQAEFARDLKEVKGVDWRHHQGASTG